MYVTATSPRFSLGRSTPATLAMFALRPSVPCSSGGFAAAILPGGGIGRGAKPPSEGLPLSGLVPRILADDPRHALTLDDLAVLTTNFDRRSYLHRVPLSTPATLLEPIGDPASGQVVRRQLDLHAVARQDPDEIHPHLAADVREHLVAVLELYPEHRVGQRLDHRSLDFDRVFFGHRPRLGAAGPDWPLRLVSTSGPSSVTATVCSKCAAWLPSWVTAVQPSSRIRTSQVPMVTMGSIARTMPGRSCGPRPGSPKFGICGSSCSARPIPWPTKARTTANPFASTCDWTACETSDSRRPGRHSWMARSRLSRVTSRSFCTFAGTAPTGRVNAQSA